MSNYRNGDNYSIVNEYSAEMIKNWVYGGFCELIAARLRFLFNLEVYRHGLLNTESRSNNLPVYLLKKNL